LDNVELSLNQGGCLQVQGKSVGETYWPQRMPTLQDGIFQTSDLVEFKDGQVFLRGRLGDQINVAGRKVSPEQIENALLAQGQVRECLVFGRPSADSSRSEVIVAVVASDAKESVLKQFLLETLPAWQVPREWQFVKTLPVNARGKISRREWRSRYANEVKS
jgi:acyl-coenzyme A synthetase/AMP-(fatty) acid ligase